MIKYDGIIVHYNDGLRIRFPKQAESNMHIVMDENRPFKIVAVFHVKLK